MDYLNDSNNNGDIMLLIIIVYCTMLIELMSCWLTESVEIARKRNQVEAIKLNLYE